MPDGGGTDRTTHTGLARFGVSALERRRRKSTPSACELWEAVVRGEWTIINHADLGGRRLFLARRNHDGMLNRNALTKREREVTGYAARGHSLKFISFELGLSLSTVSTYLKRALVKLRLRNRAELARAFGARAVRPGLRDAFAYRTNPASEELVSFALELAEPNSGEAFPSLSAAEKSIVGLLLQGSSNAAIACSRRTSVNTVANQIASIYRKLDVTSRSELYTLVARQG